MNRFSLRHTWLKFKTSGKLLIIQEESMERYNENLNLIKKTWKMSTCHRLDLGTLRSCTSRKTSPLWHIKKQDWSGMTTTWQWHGESAVILDILTHLMCQRGPVFLLVLSNHAQKYPDIRPSLRWNLFSLMKSRKIEQTSYTYHWPRNQRTALCEHNKVSMSSKS